MKRHLDIDLLDDIIRKPASPASVKVAPASYTLVTHFAFFFL